MIGDGIIGSLQGVFGNTVIMAVVILLAAIVALVIIGLDFKWAIAFSMPLVPAFYAMNWIPLWVYVMFWFLIGGVAVYLVWSNYIHG